MVCVFAWVLAALVGGGISEAAPAGGGTTFFVAPGGKDAWLGRQASANAGRTDGPFATVERARDAIRESKAKGLAGPFTVQLRGGRYVLDKAICFGPQDSGTEGMSVTYCAYGKEKPVLSGGVQVTRWRKHDERLWVADVPWARERREPFHQLFVNGIRRHRARTPNAGSYFYSKRLQLTTDHFPNCLGLSYAEGDLDRWAGEPGAMIVLFHNWVNSYNYAGSIDWERRRIRFARPAGIFFLGPSVRYYVDNVFAGLDQPGEWYLDHAKGLLYYYPTAGEEMAKAEVIAPAVLQTLVSVSGEPQLGLHVEHLVFRGISFQHTDANLSRDYPHSVQGAHTQKGAFLAAGMRRSTIEECEFTRLGEHAVSLRDGCVENTVTRCHIHDLGGGGVYLSEGAPGTPVEAVLVAHNTIDNNFIHNAGHFFRAGCGVFLGGYAIYNKITHNEICDTSWIGIHAGWSWSGRAPAYTHHNEIAYNHIHHIGNGVLNDIGGIYTLGVSPGTVLHHNLIHDVTRFERGREGYGGWGIYLDAGSSEIRVENNVVHNTRDGGLHLHCDGHPYGDEIVNNIFAYSDDAQLIRNNDKEPDDRHVLVERNIVYGRTNRMYGGGNWKPGSKFAADRNLFWSEAAEAPQFRGKPFPEWQAEGRDTHSVIADPGFIDPTKGDFRLRHDSPALKLGFQPVDVSTAGLYGPPAWRQLPTGVVHRAYEKAPPLAVVTKEEDGEEYEVGEAPDGAIAPEGDAAVAVTDQEPASGKRCMRFVDAPGVTAWKPHWCVYRSPGQGKVRMRCAVKNDAAEPATFDLEFRDWRQGAGAQFRTGPCLRFFPDGTVKAAGKPGEAEWLPLGTYPLGKWMRIEVEFEEGAGKPKVYTARIGGPDGAVLAKEGIPFRHEAFEGCTWFGIAGMDTKRALFYADEFRLE